MDQTRKQAKLEFAEHARPRSSAPRARAGPCCDTVLDLAAVGLAAEQVGGAQKVLEMAVEYAKVRVQFGRPIGSFQAIKHKCADMLLEVESAKSAAYYGMWCAAEMNDELPSVASLAKAYCSEAYFHATAENIQIHGGIGFTWEHPAHLYFKRAKTQRAAVRRPDLPPRAARPAHRHLIPTLESTLIERPGARPGPFAVFRRAGRVADVSDHACSSTCSSPPLLVFVMAAVVVGREAHRLDAVAPRSVYIPEEAVEFVAEYLPESTQARLTPDELEQLLRVPHALAARQGPAARRTSIDRRQDIAEPVVISEDNLDGLPARRGRAARHRDPRRRRRGQRGRRAPRLLRGHRRRRADGAMDDAPVFSPDQFGRVASAAMERPTRFEHTRFLGDKRTQLVYDLDDWTDAAVIDEIVAADVGLCFGPDTLAEARNRGYTLATPGPAPPAPQAAGVTHGRRGSAL